MVYTTAIVAALLAALPVNAGLYPKSSKVVQVDGKSYDRLIAQSNYTSVGPGMVESGFGCTDPADR